MIRTMSLILGVAIASTAFAQAAPKAKAKAKAKKAVLVIEVRDMRKASAAKIAKAKKKLLAIKGVSKVVADKGGSTFKVTHLSSVDPWTVRGRITDAGFALKMANDDDDGASRNSRGGVRSGDESDFDSGDFQ